MNVPPTQPTDASTAAMRARLRPMGIGDILDETFSLYRENFSLFLSTVAVVYVPFQIILILFQLTVFNTASMSSTRVVSTTNGVTTTTPVINSGTAAGLAVGGLLFALIAAIAFILLTAALAIVISNRYLGRTTTLGQAYNASFSRLGALVAAALWIGFRLSLLFLASFILIGIPFLIYFGVAWTLATQVIVLEGVGGLAASGRSRQLIKGYWWKTLGLVIVTGLLVSVISLVITGIVGGIVGAAVSSFAARTIISGLIGLVVGLLLTPIQFTATTLLFYDLKIRKDAFDLEALASSQQMGAGMGARASYPQS